MMGIRSRQRGARATGGSRSAGGEHTVTRRRSVFMRDLYMALIGGVLSCALMALFRSRWTKRPSLKTMFNHDGWNPVFVFYGRMNHLTDPIPADKWIKDSPKHISGNRWFSSDGQDIAVAKAFGFKQSGFFVDLMTFNGDAIFNSNTFALEHNLDWKGICVEPNPTNWYRLAFRKKCHVVGTVLGDQDFEEANVPLLAGSVKGADFSGGEKIADGASDSNKLTRRQKRYTLTLTSLLQMFEAPKVIDYLSLDDTQGDAATHILRNFAWKEYSILCISIDGKPSEELESILRNHEYRNALDIVEHAGFSLWLHNSIYDKAEKRLDTNPEEIKQGSVKRLPKKYTSRLNGR